MSLLLNMLSRLVITFLPRSKRLLNSQLFRYIWRGKGFLSGSKWPKTIITSFLFKANKSIKNNPCISKKANFQGVFIKSWRKVMTNLDSIFKSRDITLPTKVHLVKSMVFPVVMYGYESWTIKKAECRRTDAFELWYWRRFLRIPWTARRSNQSHPKGDQSWVFIGRTHIKAETPIPWATWCKELTHWKRSWCWERLKVGGEGDDRGWDGWTASPTWWTWVWVDSGMWWASGRSGVLQSTGSQRLGHDWATVLKWTELNWDSLLKSRDITLPTKVRLVKAMVFPVVMYGYESWTIKKAECWRIDAFELWCWRRLLRVHWTARRSNQSILNEIGPGCLLEGLMLELKLQLFGHLMWRDNSFEKTLMLGKIEVRRSTWWQTMK